MKDNLYGENMGKYKLYDPNTVANTAWENLKKATPRMKENYDRAITEAIDMDGGKNRYIAGVSAWTSVMRLPEIRTSISNAIQKAKQKLKAKLYGVPERAVAVPT